MKEQKNTKSIYNLKFPVKVVVRKEEESLHWHKDLEILCVLKGKVNLQVNNAYYELGEDDIFLINSEDLHSICMLDEKSVYLFINIGMPYFERFFKELEYIVFIDDNSINTPSNEELQKNIRLRIAQILIEIKNKNVDYQSRIIYNASALLAILIDNYNMVKKNISSLKNKDQLSRIWKAYEYLYINYYRKIELKEVADYVHVSVSYLSHIIKEAMGLSFEQLLNQIRAERSMKFLLNSEDSISKISDECGFSDPKYFNKYFLQFFHCTPREYRESNRHKVSEGDFEAQSFFETILFNELLINKITQYLDEPVKESDETAVDIVIDFDCKNEELLLDKYWNKEVIVDLTGNTGIMELVEKIKVLQEEIKFESVYLKGLLNREFFNLQSEHIVYTDWNKLDYLVDYIVREGASLKLDCRNSGVPDSVVVELVKKIILHYKLRYRDNKIMDWVLVCDKRQRKIMEEAGIFINEVIHPINQMIQIEYVQSENMEWLKVSDQSGISLINEIIMNNRKIENNLECLIDQRGLKSNLFFAYLFLNKLERQIIKKGKNYFITKGNNRLVILIFNSKENNRNAIENAINVLELKKRRYVLKQFSLYSQQEKTDIYLKNVKDSDYISEEDIRSINRGRYPDLCIEFFEQFESIHRSITTTVNRAEIFIIERVI